MIKLSVIVPSLTGEVPPCLMAQVAGRDDVELVSVIGVAPVGKARNEGLRRAKGDYIAWVDADDDVEPNWLEEILKAIGEKPDVVVIGHRCEASTGFAVTEIWEGGDLLRDMLRMKGIFGELWKMVVCRELWLGVRFDDTARTMEDWEVMPQLLVRVESVRAIGRCLYVHRKTDGSLTNRDDADLQCEIFRRAVARVDLVKSLGLWERYGHETMIGIGYVVYNAGETSLLRCHGEVARTVRTDAAHWLRQHLVELVFSQARARFKVKWVLGALELWRVVLWFYRMRGDGR